MNELNKLLTDSLVVFFSSLEEEVVNGINRVLNRE